MKKRKINQRTLSFFYIGIFITGILLLVTLSINLVHLHQINQDLINEKQRLEEEMEYIKDIENNVNEGYYVVYAEGEYALDIHGEIIVIYN